MAAPLGGACGGGTDSLTIRTDSAGVEIVRYTGPDRVPPLRFIEELRLGGSETRAEESFFEVHASTVGTDASGNLYVLDRPESRVLVFDRQGRFLRQMGRAGGGPGEIGMATVLTVSPDGTAGVFDISKRGLVRFDSSGYPLPIAPVPPAYFGGLIYAGDDALVLPVQEPAAEGGRHADQLLRVAGGDTARLAVMPLNEMKPIHLESCGMRFSGMPPIFSPSLRWSANQSQVAAATGAAYEITLYEGTRVVRQIRRDVAPLSASEQLAVREIGEGMQVRTERGVVRCHAHEVVAQRGYAATVPAIGRLALSPDGWVWVERAGGRDDPKPIDLFSPDGEYAGTLPAGSPFPVAFLSEGRIATAEKDEFDVVRLVVYHVQPTD